MESSASSSGLGKEVPSKTDNENNYLRDKLHSSSSAPATKWKRLTHSMTRFNPTWMKQHPCITKVTDEPGKAFCTVYNKSFSVCHQGYRVVERHMNGLLHHSKSCAIVAGTRKIMDSFVSDKNDISSKAISAKVKFTAFLSELVTISRLLQQITQSSCFVLRFQTVT